MRNLQEGRHALAEKIFHGRRRELFQRYREGMEDQLGVLGIVLNCVVLWNTVYIDAALNTCAPRATPCETKMSHASARSCETMSTSTGNTPSLL